MRRIVFKTSEAAASQSGAMEPETISKNGASLKSHTGRGNLKKMMCFALFATVFIFSGCKKDDPLPPVDEDGLTEDIRNIIPDDILEKFKELGIEINGGNKPPNIEGTYLISPLILVKSNFTDFILPGDKFDDGQYTFSQQDNAKLTIVCDYEQGTQSGNGLGSFITGTGNKFSVYTEISGTYGSSPFKSVDIYSGEITPTGIKNVYWAAIITMEAPGTIKRGQGRLVYDSDGFSEKIEKKAAVYEGGSSILSSVK